MLTMDVFNGDAFKATSLSTAVDKLGYVPGYLGSLPGLVVPTPIRTTSVWIEERAFAPALIKTSPRGAPPSQVGGDKRDARQFKTVRLAEGSRITSEELEGIRAFGSETELKQLQEEISRRQAKIKADHEMTREHMRLGMVQGKVLDADGSVIYDWFDEFEQEEADAIIFDLASVSAKDGDILTKANGVRRDMLRSLQGVGGSGVSIHALCGDEFFDAFTTSAEVRDTYKFSMKATDLQNDVGGAFESFRYGKIIWHNYRGSDDKSQVAVPDDEVKFFPVGAGIFPWAQAPAEGFGFNNTLGQETYSWIVRDLQRDQWADVEVNSYPLPVCTMPQALRSGRAG